MSEFSFWTACVLDGIATGFIYGLLALSIVLMYRSNKLFNLSQTSFISLLMIVAATSLKKFSFPVVFAGTMVAGFVVGLLLHLGVMRQITENRHGSHLTEVLAIFGLMSVFDGLATFVFGDTPLPFPSLFPDGAVQIAEFNFSYNSIGVIVFSLSLILIIGLFFRFSTSGLLMEAVAENIVAARLRGIRASNILAMAWGVTGVVGMLAGLLMAPTLFVSPTMLAPAFGFSLMAVVIGGLESPSGAVLGGVIVGVTENLAGNIEWLGSELKFAAVFFMLVLITIIRPRGLFGRADARRV